MGSETEGCCEYRRWSRRRFLRTGVQAGALTAFGLGLTDLMAIDEARAAAGATEAATSVILIWMGGGPSHLDTFDPKPDAPAEIRGLFRPIETRAPGVQISEHLPLLARQMDKVALIRAMTTPEAAHERGTHYLLTGFPPLPGFGVPSMGAVVAKYLPSASALPPYIAIPGPLLYGGAGFLGAALDPFAPGGDPSSPGFQVRDLDLPPGVTVKRMERRRSLRAVVDSVFAQVEKGSDRARTVDAFYQRAYALLESPRARAAFDLNQETPAVRDAYGRNAFGQGLLLARRLVEGGVRFVTVSHGGWDTHNNAFDTLRYATLPPFDRGVATLLEDLHQRGRLTKTLVLAMGEFGRTPVINRDGGRDHHSRCFGALLAGGGVKGGQAIGASDARGMEPAERPVHPEDLTATVYRCLGIDYTQSLSSPEGVRITLSRGGRPIAEALG